VSLFSTQYSTFISAPIVQGQGVPPKKSQPKIAPLACGAKSTHLTDRPANPVDSNNFIKLEESVRRVGLCLILS